MSEKCNTCGHKSLYDMTTSHKPYCYSGDIPCLRCVEYLKPHSEYVPVSTDKERSLCQKQD
jgi:endogenous inhibitor of DNA gyrase (YacG/DUF329 family)